MNNINFDPNISFDLSSITNILGLSQSQTNDLMKTVLTDISQAVIFNWREEAHRTLSGSRTQYMNGIQQPVINGNIAIIELLGMLPNMIENGAPAFDMKEGFKNSPKVKYNKNGGWFLTIPFRFATSSAIGENESFSNKMPSEVHSVAKELSATKTGKNKMVYGSSLQESDLPNKYQGLKSRKAITNKEGTVIYGAYKHKTNIFQGMKKFEKSYKNATQNQYFTFRRVSSNSDPLSWIHPGFVAKDLASKAISSLDVETVIDNSANIFAESLGL